MRSVLLIFFLFMFEISVANDSDSSNGYFTAKVFLHDQDTFITVVHLNKYKGDFIKYLYMEKFGHYLDRKNKIRKLDADKIDGFEVKIDNKIYTFISKQKNEEKDKRTFFLLMNKQNNTIKLYQFYNSKVMAASLVISPWIIPELVDAYYAIEYSNGANENVLYFPKRKDFRYDKLGFILSDNKDIEKKIEDMTYKYDDMPLIIAEYNNWYATK